MRAARYLFATAMIIISKSALMAQTETIQLWPTGQVPNYIENKIEEKSVTDKDGILRISGVTVPSMTAFIVPKEKASGAAVLICPGGGYGILAASHEGSDLAKWFNARGISAFVLKYRLPNPAGMSHQHEVPLMDAMQAMKLVRESAAKWNINVDKIGVMGFSAGGHLAATLSTHYNMGPKASDLSKPNFSILLYPVISFMPDISHGGSRDNLLGAEKSDELIKYYSNELQVSDKTPPAFLVHSMNDGAVPIENTFRYALALNKLKIPVEVHAYPMGGHGYGLRTDGKGSLAGWPAAMEGWLKAMGYTK